MKSIGFALIALAASAASAVPATDLGRVTATEQVSATVVLQLRNQDQLEGMVSTRYDSASPSYHQFLTAAQFSAQFAPSAQTVNRVVAQLAGQGLNVEVINGAYLRVTGASADVERAFSVQMHNFTTTDASFHGPIGRASVHPSIAADVQGVVGLNTQPRFHAHLHRSPANLTRVPPPKGAPASGAPNTPDPPGQWTVVDLADYYDVNPLYAKGISGKNTTIGIVTLAAFTPSDAFFYWNTVLGLTVDPNRITIVNVDGGPGAPSDASGSDETTLDVQQSGGLAPAAKIIVYQAPNTDQAFVDAFAQAIGDNTADAISCSWGEWEEFLVQGNANVSDPDAAGDIQAMHNLFIQAALQGQSVSIAAGDSGAFDANEVFEPPDPVTGDPGFSSVVSVDHPSSDPFVTAAGGTTLPGPQTYAVPGGTLTINIKNERAWGWDYLQPLCNAVGDPNPVDCGIFPVGGGGGVSVVFPRPIWQDLTFNIKDSEKNQTLFDESTTPPTPLITLPSRFPGRNLPDISLNADPQTGYIIPYTSIRGTKHRFEIAAGGGTSFVAPQLAGITALIDQNAHGRIGLLSLALYEIGFLDLGYLGKHAPLRDITSGGNEFYNAGPGFDQATGFGVLDVANLAAVLH
jgi:kumamolisin